MQEKLKNLELEARRRQVSNYEDTLRWIRIQILQSDPSKYGYIAATIDNVLAQVEDQPLTHTVA